MAQYNLGMALFQIGLGTIGGDALDRALSALRGALDVWTPQTAFPQWAEARKSLGLALNVLGEERRDAAMAGEAVDILADLSRRLSREHAPLAWAEARQGLFGALAVLGGLQASRELLAESLEAARAARGAYLELGMDGRVAAIEAGMATVEAMLAQVE